MKEKIFEILKASISTKEHFFQEYADQIVEVSHDIAKCFSNGRKVLLFGNGGSSTDASHIAAEFVNRYQRERPGLPALALNTDMAVITSIANDYNYSEVFARQLKSIAEAGDVVIAISTSGISRNILKATDVASRKKLTSIAFTGRNGTEFAKKATYAFVVPSENTPRIQETHNILGHIICQLVEEILFDLPRIKQRTDHHDV